jgi:hypothetical protein
MRFGIKVQREREWLISGRQKWGVDVCGGLV